MPTLFSHPAPVLCFGLALNRGFISWRLLAAALVLSVLPDMDVIGFKFGVYYANILGHRGLSHSLAFAVGMGAVAFLAAPWLHARRLTAFLVCTGAVTTHIALDALTNGGLGVAVLWPFSEARHFFPWQPIEVSPFAPRHFLTARGARVLLSEWQWVWLPSLAMLCAIRFCAYVCGRHPQNKAPRQPIYTQK